MNGKTMLQLIQFLLKHLFNCNSVLFIQKVTVMMVLKVVIFKCETE